MAGTTNTKNFIDPTGNLLKVGDIVTYVDRAGETKMIVARIMGFTNKQVKIRGVLNASLDANSPSDYRAPDALSVINRNEEISAFPDEWLTEFVVKGTLNFDWSSINAALNNNGVKV